MKPSKAEKIFKYLNTCFMIVMIAVTLYPVLYVLFASFSDPNQLLAHSGLLLRPAGFSMEAYQAVVKYPTIISGFVNTLHIMFWTLLLNMILTILGAYVLSRKNVLWNSLVMKLMVFTMYFSGGMIPQYLNVMQFGLLNSHWAIILTSAVNVFNLIILRTSFLSIPDSLCESANIDGANHMQILLKIVIPLSKPVLMVVLLYYIVGAWNSWFSAMIYLQDKKLFPVQLVLRNILLLNDTNNIAGSAGGEGVNIGETIKYAVIILTSLPIMCVYPFLQKYFVKGVMIGAVKG